MPDVPGTGGPGLFQGPGREEAVGTVEVPTQPEALQALEARGTALLLGMLSRLQAVEGILRQERIARLTAEETAETIVIDNEEAQALIVTLQSTNILVERALVEIKETFQSVIVDLSQAVDLIRITSQLLIDNNIEGQLGGVELRQAITLLSRHENIIIT